MKVILMAGGKGTRLRPLTCTVPKPMVPMMDRPLCEHTLRLLRKQGFYSASLTLMYLPNAVREYFGDGERVGMRLDYFVEDSPLGTAGSVLSASAGRERTLVLSGDALTDIDLRKAIEFHEQHGAAATLILKEVENPLEYGVVMTDSSGRITRFIEKPEWSLALSDRVNTGIYILEPRVWEGFAKGSRFDFSMDLFPRLLERGEALYGFVAPGYWCDVGNLQQYLQAHRDILDGKCKVELPECVQGCYAEEGATLEHGAKIKGPCYLGAGCRIQSGASVEAYSVIGRGCVVESGASVRRSVLWQGAAVRQNAELRGAVLCAKAVIGANASVFEDSAIGERTRIGSNASVRAGACVWPEKTIEDACVVSDECRFGPYERSIFYGDGICAHPVDLPGELLCRLGRSLAASCGENARICLATDGSAPACTAKYALFSGVMEGGADVIDAGCCVAPALREAVGALCCAAGVYCRLEEGLLYLDVFGTQGRDAGRGALREIAQSYADGGQRAPLDAMGVLAARIDPSPYYTAQVLRRSGFRALRERGGQVALLCPNELEYAQLCALFSGCGAAVTRCCSAQDAERAAKKHGTLVLQMQQEDLRLLLPRRTLAKEDLFLFCANLDLKLGAKELRAGVLSSCALEPLAERCGAKVLRMPRRELRATLCESSLLSAQFLVDPYSAALGIFAALQKLGLSAEEAAASLPFTARCERVFPVRPQEIGRIFRTIAGDGQDTDLTEGLLLKKGSGWVNIFPDHSGRRMKVVGSAFAEEYAQSLADFYVGRAERAKEISEKQP